MNITQAMWADAAHKTIKAVVDGTEMWVPDASGNLERRAIAEWEDEGNVISAYVAPPPPPITVMHKAYINAALSQMDQMDAVNQAVATMPVWKQQLWEFPSNINMNDADVITVCKALSIDRRKLFDLAETIRTARQVT